MVNVEKLNKFKADVLLSGKADPEVFYFESRDAAANAVADFSKKDNVESVTFSKLFELDYVPILKDDSKEENLWIGDIMHLHNVNNMHGVLYARRFIILIPNTKANGWSLEFSTREEKKFVLHVFIPETADNELPEFTNMTVYSTDDDNNNTGTVTSIMIPIKEFYEKYHDNKGEALPENCKDMSCFMDELTTQYIQNMALMYNPYFFTV